MSNNETINYMRMDKITSVIFHDQNYQNKVELELGDYEIKQEDGKWFAVKKKPKYPTTYEECCKIKCCDTDFYVDTHLYSDILGLLYKLLICRDAYWKIAGEEMGLGKSWKPDWESLDKKYNIYNYRGDIKYDYYTIIDRCLLVFPTEEMRDAFYENFKDLIEECKELL